MDDAELVKLLRNMNEYEPLGHDGWKAADRIEALVKERDRQYDENVHRIAEQAKAEARAERLEAAVLAAAKIGQIVGALGEDESCIEAFREACGPELWAKARAAIGGEA